MAKHCRGRYTDKEIQRCAQMSGAYGKSVDSIFAEAGLLDKEADSVSHKPHFKKDIAKFVSEYQQDALVDYLPTTDRIHRGFKNYERTVGLPRPRDMALKILQLSQDLDLWRELPEMEMEL